MKGTLEGAQYMHTKDRAHNDIKPDNVMISSNRKDTSQVQPKLVDMGQSGSIKDPAGVSSKSSYRAPETETLATQKSDVYGVGGTAYFLAKEQTRRRGDRSPRSIGAAMRPALAPASSILNRGTARAGFPLQSSSWPSERGSMRYEQS